MVSLIYKVLLIILINEGRRASTVLSSSSQIPSGKSTQRIEIVELESILKEKVRSQVGDIRIKFRHCADFDSNGKISREAFKHVIASIFGTQRQISSNQIDQLLEKVHLKDFKRIRSSSSFSFSLLNLFLSR